MEKKVAIGILEDIQDSLQKENWKKESLKTIDIYRKGLLIATNDKIKKLIEESKRYDENSVKYRKIGKKIDEEVQKIYNS